MPAIGTVRPEEARVFDSEAGLHHVPGSDLPVMVEWLPDHRRGPGWYHYTVNEECLQVGDSVGPFASSIRALSDAQPDED